MVCLRESLPEVREQIQNLADKLGVDYGTAKIILLENNGYDLDKAPSGAESKLYLTLLEHYNGDERKALIAKAKTYLQPFFDWFGNWTDPDATNVSKVVDENGEPLVVYHGTSVEFDAFDFEKLGETTGKGYYTDKYTGEKILIDSSYAFFFTNNVNAAYSYRNLGIWDSIQEHKLFYENTLTYIRYDGAPPGYLLHGMSDLKFVQRQRQFIDNVLSPVMGYNVRDAINKRLLTDSLKKILLEKLEKVLSKIHKLDDARSISNMRNNYDHSVSTFNILQQNKKQLVSDEYFFEYDFIKYDAHFSGSGESVSITKKLDGYYFYPELNNTFGTTKLTEHNIDAVFLKIQNILKNNKNEFIQSEKIAGYDKGIVLPVFLNIKNPLSHNYNNSAFPDKYKIPAEPNDKQASRNILSGQLLKDAKFKDGTPIPTGYVAARQVLKAIKDGNDGVIYENINDPFEMNSYGIFLPNQTKSIDNRGTFSTTDDRIEYYNPIYDSPDNDHPMSDETFDALTSYPKDGKYTAKQFMQTMLTSNEFFQEPVQQEIALKLFDKITPEMEVVFSNAKDELMFCKGDTITVTLNAFKRMNTYEFGHGFMHEVMHPIIRKEAGEGGYLFKTIERIRKDVESKVTKEELESPLFYGLKDSKDFASEIFTNPFFRDELVKRYSPKWWRKLLLNILNFFGLKKLGDKVIKDSEYVYNEISKIVDGYTGNPAYDKLVGNTIERYAPGITNQILKDATNEAKKIQTGLNTRLKALKSALNQDPVRIADLQKLIRQYEDMLIQGEIQECFVDFIKTSNPLYNSILKKMRRAVVDPNTISNDELLQIKNDFIDFYGPTLAEFKNNFFVNGFFDNLSPNEKTVIARNLTLIERAHTEIQAKWNVLIKDKAATVLKTFAEAQGRPTEDIDNYLNDELNLTDADVNYYSRFILSSGRVTEMAVSTMHRVMSDCDQETTRFANDVLQDLKSVANGVSRKDILLLFEKDSQGRATGKLIRPLNYGAFQNDYKAFITRLNQSYGVTEGEVYSLPDDEFIEYHREKENWLCNHCERKFKESYYLAYAELSPTTRQTLSDINDEIKRITDKVASSTGAKLENLSDYDYKRLNDLYKYKRNLANKYDEYGNIKFGDDLKIAEELTKFNKTIASGGFGVSYTQQQIKDLIDTKKRTLSAAEFKKWYDRNVSITYSLAFSDQLSNLAKTDYGQRYKDLLDEKNALLRYGRDTITPYVDASKLSPKIRQRIKEIDEEQAYIRETTVGIKTGTIPFSLVANTEPTLRYNHDKAAAQAKGQAYYQKWYDDNHVDGKPVSYYTKLIPKHQSDIEFRLNPMNQELSSDSPLMNPNFDFSSTETRQPKIHLYNNRKAFNNATRTIHQEALYNKIVQIMEQANQKLPWLDMQSAYNLPLKTGDKIDYIFRSKSNIFKGWWDYNVDAMVIRPDDPGYALDNFSAKPGGGLIDFIPTYYVRQLDNTDYISRNLLGMVAEYARMAENYRVKREHQGDFMIIDEMLAGRDVVGKNGLVAKRAGSETKTYKKYHEMLNMRLYGRMFKEFTVNWGFVKFKFPVKAWQNMISYATKLGLAWNRNSIVKSFFLAHLRTITEAVGHRYFNATDLICAIGQQIAYIPKWFAQLGNPYANDFSIALMQHLNIAREFTLNIEDLQYNRLFRIASKYGMMGGWSFIDYFVKTPIVKAIAANFRLDPTSGKFMPKHKFINIYYADNRSKGAKEFNKLKTRWINVVTSKNGKIIPKKGYEHLEDAINDKDTINLLRNVSEFVTNRIDGKISEEDKTQWMTSIIGSAACMHRWYYLFNLDDNFASRYQYNPMIEDYYEARFQSVAKVIIKSMLNLAIAMQNVFGANKEYKKMSSVALYNFRRSLGHLLTVTSSVMLLYGLIYPLVFGIGKANDDDDDDNDDSFDVSDLFDDTENTAKKHNSSWRFLNFAKDVLVGLAASAEAATQEEYSEYPTISFKNGLFKPTIPLLNQLDGGDMWSTITPASSGFSSLYNATFGNLFNLNYNFSKTYKSGSYEGMHYGTRNIIRAIPGLRNLMDFGNVYKTHSMVTKNRPDVFWAANDLFRKKPKKQTESDFDFDFDFDF